jgi:fatty acid desaturase
VRALRYDARVADSPAPLIAGDVLTLPELRHLRRVSGLRGAGLVLHAWAVIIGAMFLYVAWPSAVTLVLAIALIGPRQLGLAVLMHEGAHWRLASRQG